MFELRAEGTIFGEVGRVISQEDYDNLVLEKDKHLFKEIKIKSRKSKLTVTELDREIRSVTDMIWETTVPQTNSTNLV